MQEFNLQEKCFNGASDYFEKNKRDAYFSENFSNHYNKKLNKCFILVTGVFMNNVSSGEDKYLFDVFDHKDIADWSYSIPKGKNRIDVKDYCIFPGNELTVVCTEEEFDLFIKSYMEE